MASSYENQNPHYFGSTKAAALSENFEKFDARKKALAKVAVKESKEQINNGINRIIQTVNKMHQKCQQLLFL